MAVPSRSLASWSKPAEWRGRERLDRRRPRLRPPSATTLSLPRALGLPSSSGCPFRVGDDLCWLSGRAQGSVLSAQVAGDVVTRRAGTSISLLAAMCAPVGGARLWNRLMTLRLLLVDDSTYFLRAARYAPRAGGGGRRGRGLDQRRGDRAAPARCGRTSRSSTSTSARRAASTAPGDSQRTPAPARDGWCSSPPIPKPTCESSSTPARPSGSCRSRSSRAKPSAGCSARETGASSAASRYVTTAGRAVVVGRHRTRS